jgi:hypothetical protein
MVGGNLTSRVSEANLQEGTAESHSFIFSFLLLSLFLVFMKGIIDSRPSSGPTHSVEQPLGVVVHLHMASGAKNGITHNREDAFEKSLSIISRCDLQCPCISLCETPCQASPTALRPACSCMPLTTVHAAG